MEAQPDKLVQGNQGVSIDHPLFVEVFNGESTQEMAVTLSDSHFFNSNLLSVYGSNDAPLFKPTEVCP